MRSLRIVVRRASGTLPFVVAASVSSAPACGNSERTARTSGSASGGASSGGASSGGVSSGGVSSGGTLSVGGTSIVVPTGGNAAGGIGSDCQGEPGCYTIDIPIPQEGMPIAPGEVCSATVEPAESNRAALVTLERSTAASDDVIGTITVDAAVTVLGIPAVEVLDATSAELGALQISDVQPSAGGGFTFRGHWPAPLMLDATRGYERMTLRVTLEAACDGGSHQLHAVTDVHLCLIDGAAAWASSGQSCCVCRIIAEMAPSPIVPDRPVDALPLARALRLRVVELARISNTVVLFAENDGGDGLEYEWLPSAGRIERLAEDVIAWTLDEGTPDPFIQAAVFGDDTAAVASFAFNDRAA